MNRLIFKAFLVFYVTLLHSLAWGACRVITPTGSGDRSGSGWNNACAGFTGNCSTSNMVRGDSYYLGKGTYPSQTFNKANSGTSTISIKSPTDADHCTDTGFSAATHVGQASFNSAVIIDTDYWIFDGQYGTEFSKGSYGIKFQWAAGNNIDALYCQNGCSNSTFRYIELKGSNYANSYCDEGMLITGYNHPSTPTSNVLIDHAYGYQSSGNFKFNSVNNVTLQNSVLDENYSNANCHGENIATTNSIVTIRYNKIKNCVGTACMATPCAVCGPSQFAIYGNTFWKTTGACTDNGGSATCLSSIFRNLGDSITSLKIYNNTFAGFSAAGMVSGYTVDVWYNSHGTTSGDDFKNNLFYNNGPIDLGNGANCSSNSYYATTRKSAACAGDQTGTSDPFVDSKSDFHLKTDVAAWSALSSPYNLDPDNITRVSSRGAYQFAGGVSVPNPPTALTAVVQ